MLIHLRALWAHIVALRQRQPLEGFYFVRPRPSRLVLYRRWTHRILGVVLESAIWFAVVVISYTCLLYSARVIWLAYRSTYIGERYGQNFPHRAQLVSDLLSPTPVYLTMSITLQAVTILAVAAVLARLLELTNALYHSRSTLGKLILWSLPLTLLTATQVPDLVRMTPAPWHLVFAAGPVVVLMFPFLRMADSVIPEISDLLEGQPYLATVWQALRPLIWIILGILIGASLIWYYCQSPMGLYGIDDFGPLLGFLPYDFVFMVQGTSFWGVLHPVSEYLTRVLGVCLVIGFLAQLSHLITLAYFPLDWPARLIFWFGPSMVLLAPWLKKLYGYETWTTPTTLAIVSVICLLHPCLLFSHYLLPQARQLYGAVLSSWRKIKQLITATAGVRRRNHLRNR